MAKRVYIRPKNDKPKPLKSNWPDLGAPVESQEFIKEAKVEVASKFVVKWEYLLYSGNRLIGRYRDKEKAERMKAALWKERLRVWIHYHEPTPEQAHEQRQREKAEWRWQAGFGA